MHVKGSPGPGRCRGPARQVLAIVSDIIRALSYQGPSPLVCTRSRQCSLGVFSELSVHFLRLLDSSAGTAHRYLRLKMFITGSSSLTASPCKTVAASLFPLSASGAISCLAAEARKQRLIRAFDPSRATRLVTRLRQRTYPSFTHTQALMATGSPSQSPFSSSDLVLSTLARRMICLCRSDLIPPQIKNFHIL